MYITSAIVAAMLVAHNEKGTRKSANVQLLQHTRTTRLKHDLTVNHHRRTMASIQHNTPKCGVLPTAEIPGRLKVASFKRCPSYKLRARAGKGLLPHRVPPVYGDNPRPLKDLPLGFLSLSIVFKQTTQCQLQATSLLLQLGSPGVWAHCSQSGFSQLQRSTTPRIPHLVPRRTLGPPEQLRVADPLPLQGSQTETNPIAVEEKKHHSH